MRLTDANLLVIFFLPIDYYDGEAYIPIRKLCNRENRIKTGS